LLYFIYRSKNRVKAPCDVSNWTTETDSQASGSAANAVDINESGSGKVESGSAKVGESESEGAICLQDRLKWLDKPVVRKVVVFFLKAHPHEFLQSKVFHATCCFMFDYT
jgi:hypothetical protein